jgi:AraC-like DNA-binding protein
LFTALESRFYIPQIPHIKSIIHSIWQVEGSTPYCKESIMPKGIAEVIFNFGDGFSIPALIGNKSYSLSKCFINGFNTAPIQMQLPCKQLFFGVRFQVLAIKKIFRTPASEFSDTVVDLALIDPAIHSLWQQLGELDNFDLRATFFCQWIEGKVSGTYPREQLINDFLSSGHHHDLPVEKLAGSLCYSTKQLCRKISEATGMNTEDILLYKKYLHSLHLIHNSDLSLTAIAHQSNFFDQSHFIRSFKVFTNMTPGEYQRKKSHLAGHVFEDVR